MNDVVGRYKWVGTRPIRPDGVPKVTGKAMYAADYTMPGAIIGRILRSPHAHARIRSIDTSKAERAARGQGGHDREGPPGPQIRVCRPRAGRGQFLARHAQHHGAREGAV